MNRMKEYISRYIAIDVFLCFIFLCSCTKDYFEESYRVYKLRFDYHQNDNRVSFEVYKENPLSEDEGSMTIVKRDDAKPIFTGTTDENGKFTGTLVGSTLLKEVYLYAKIEDNISCVRITFSGDNIAASIYENQNQPTTTE
ncbi:hypothetical protein [Coprobacter sp.]